MASTFKETLSRTGSRYARVFSDLNTGQKIVAIIGTGALLLGGFLVFRWISAPSYAPLYSNLSSKDAAAVTEELDSTGVPYKLADGGSMIMVPRDKVYQTRIDLSADGIPEGGEGGYSILDSQGLSTSDFQEQTSYKRAMEGELAKTIGAIDGIDTAVVHLALPEKQVFSDNQQPTTASVLVDTRPGSGLDADQVQGIVHLVASSIEGLDPSRVTVADSTGTVLTSADDAPGTNATTRDRQQQSVEQSLQTKLQTMLDRVVGPGNSTVQVNANLDFDATETETTDYTVKKKNRPSSESINTETYQGPAGGGTIGGVVGPDGQMDPGTNLTSGGASNYTKKQKTSDTPVDVVREHRQTAPGGIKSIHVGVALDSATTGAYAVGDIRDLVQDALGITTKRGDTVRVVQMPFDRSAEEQAVADIKAAQLAEQKAARASAMRTGGIAGAILLVLLLALFRARRHHRARQEATTYVVEQIRQEQAARAAALDHTSLLALESPEPEEELSEEEQLRAELDALIERQPEDVAVLLRGWLTERA